MKILLYCNNGNFEVKDDEEIYAGIYLSAFGMMAIDVPIHCSHTLWRLNKKKHFPGSTRALIKEKQKTGKG